MNKLTMWTVGGLLLCLGIGLCPASATEAPMGMVIPAQPKALKEPASMPFGIVLPKKESKIPPEAARLWYGKELQRITAANHCRAMAQYQHNYPFYQLLTPEVLVAWCIENNPRDPLPPNFHLVIIPRAPTHSWASCPRFFSMPYNSEPLYVWIEKPTTLDNQPWPLQQLVYQSDNDGVMRPGPTEGYATGPGLWYGLIGNTGGFLYCHKGKWLTGGIH